MQQHSASPHLQHPVLTSGLTMLPAVEAAAPAGPLQLAAGMLGASTAMVKGCSAGCVVGCRPSVVGGWSSVPVLDCCWMDGIEID